MILNNMRVKFHDKFNLMLFGYCQNGQLSSVAKSQKSALFPTMSDRYCHTLACFYF